VVRIARAPGERRSELIDCAQVLLCSKAYESTSLGDIVNQVGVARYTLYYWFAWFEN